jgi:hypothetical protein
MKKVNQRENKMTPVEQPRATNPNDVDAFSVLSFEARILRGEDVERYRELRAENVSVDSLAAS